MRLSAIVPATNDPPTLGACLRAIEDSTRRPDETVVVRESELAGPAAARNAGAEAATGDVLVFVDADVAVHPDAFDRVEQAFVATPDLAALFGSYDDDPRGGTLVSDFRNLLHHHVHQTSAGEASTFWAGLGAIRRDVFAAVGGFDTARFQVPSVEDIELGMRVTDAGGRIVLDPTVQGRHLKVWTLPQMVHTDVVKRGIPWTLLLLARRGSTSALNLGWRHRLGALASLAGAAALVLRRPLLAAGSLAALLALHRPFYALLRRRLGARGVVAGVGLHAIHHLSGVVSVPAAIVRHLRERRPR